MYLNCKTNLSFRYGTFTTEKLVEEAVAQGVSTLALTNINNTCDMWLFVEECHNAHIQPVAGAEIRNDNQFLYILLAENSLGLREINLFLSVHLHQKNGFPARPGPLPHVFVIYPLEGTAPDQLNDHEFIGVKTNEINKLFSVNLTSHRNKFVIRQPVTFKDNDMYNTHRLLRAIDRNIIISKQLRSDIAEPNEYFIEPATLLEKFRQYSFMITNTFQLMEQCSVNIPMNTDKTKKSYSTSPANDRILLEKLSLDGMRMRYGTKNKAALERVQKELQIIHEQQFNAYFLITCDIIRYARNRQFYFVGRGSGANSIIAYCLGITDVDPLELDLYFERFMNPKRKVPPDFDIDFSWRDRDEIIDYVFKRYGKDHVCLLGSYTTFQSRAIFRELGKVFGLPKEEIEALEKGTLNDDNIQRKISYFTALLKNFPNHLSIHAGGILISEEPIYQYTATELPPKGFCTSQIDMHMAEKIGLFKLDLLSQRGLGHIRETIELVQQNKKTQVDITKIDTFKKDPKIATEIRRANTIGCFYIESPAMRQLLKKLECDNYITLVAASSIIRPGVAQSGMMKQYIHRFHHPDDFTYLHPIMKELLQETYGVMVYQEDVIKVAHYFAGLDMAEADVLRRAMSGKYRSHKEFEKIKDHFFSNCKEKGYPDTLTTEVWRQIQSFGGYSFSKAHSASFAVESYQSLYLKTYYPIEFMVAVINNFGGFYDRELYFTELKKAGATVHLPCINHSQYYTTLSAKEVYMGFIHLKDLEEQLVKDFLEIRNTEGAFSSLHHFMDRLQPDAAQVNILIKTGAFGFTGRSKKELLWEANFVQKKQARTAPGKTLFTTEPVKFVLPTLSKNPLDDALDEIELIGFPLCNFFELVDDDPNQYISARDIHLFLGKEVEVLGRLVTTKSVNTVTNELMYFGTFQDAHGDWLDTVHFPNVQQQYPLGKKGFYRMKGKVTEDFGVFVVEVNWCKKIGIKERNAQPNQLTSTTASANTI